MSIQQLSLIHIFIGIPVLIWIALVVAACFWFLYNKTRHGKYMYCLLYTSRCV